MAQGQQPDTTKNNGKVGQMTSTILGTTEVVNYKYDSLNRLINAYTNDTSANGWGLAWDYDGFGNRLSQTVTQGTAQPMTSAVDQATNRSGVSFDNNGNMTNGGAYVYDIENRLISANNGPGSPATDNYDYAPDNKRIYKKTTNGSNVTESVYYYSGSRKLATYQINYYGTNNSKFFFTQSSTNIYFGGKLIQAEGSPVVTDRLGTVVWDNKGAHRYFPYGEERTNTTNESSKFGTYFRDQTTGSDYAVNRYYSSQSGKFLIPDPLGESAKTVNPQSWNKFAYVNNDPVNDYDPLGLDIYGPDQNGCYWDSDTDVTTCPEVQKQKKGTKKADIRADQATLTADLDNAVDLALLAIEDGGNDCASLFNLGGDGLDPVELLETLLNGGTDYGSIIYGQFGATAKGAETTTQLNAIGSSVSSGVSITLNANPGGMFINNTDKERAVVLLHELGHAYAVIYGDSYTKLLKDDDKTAQGKANSVLHSDKIREACFK